MKFTNSEHIDISSVIIFIIKRSVTGQLGLKIVSKVFTHLPIRSLSQSFLKIVAKFSQSCGVELSFGHKISAVAAIWLNVAIEGQCEMSGASKQK